MEILTNELPVWICPSGIAPEPESPPGVASPADGPPMMPGLGNNELVLIWFNGGLMVIHGE